LTRRQPLLRVLAAFLLAAAFFAAAAVRAESPAAHSLVVWSSMVAPPASF